MGREGEFPNPSDEQAGSLPTPTKLPFSDSGTLNLTPEEAQASSTGREGDCSNPNDELPFSDSGAPNPIPEEARASSMGREEENPNPSDEPMTTGDPVMDTLPARLTSLELQPQLGRSGPNGDADPPGRGSRLSL